MPVLAEKTIKNYVSHLLRKLEMRRRIQATALAAELRAAQNKRDEWRAHEHGDRHGGFDHAGVT